MATKILIADDYRNYVTMLQKTLGAEGFQTIAVYDGEAAIEKARAEKPDLILLDIMMPKVGGTEVRIELLKDPETKNIPILFLTGLRAPHLAKKTSLDGVKVVGKSDDFSELLASIRETLPKSVRS